MSDAIIHLPFDVPLLPVKELQAEKFSCVYEKGNLRYICFAGAEVLCMIYPAVRDEEWGTVTPQIENEVMQCHDDYFHVHYTALYQQADIQFKADISIAGNDCSIEFYFKGEALCSFKKNRIGLCVLHPVQSLSGKDVVVTRADETQYTASAPFFVSPHQPFKGVQKMEWPLSDNHRVQLQFEGDVFETEDQRNWTDHSYKTYSTPLARPFPALIEKGTRVEQKVVLKIIDQPVESPSRNEPTEKISVGTQQLPLMVYDITLPESITLNFLTGFPFRCIHLTLKLASANWKETLIRIGNDAHANDLSLSLTVVFSGSFSEECVELFAVLSQFWARVENILPLQENSFATPPQLLEHVYPRLKKLLPETKIGYGTNRFFAELNRNRPLNNEHDFVAFGMHPQVHTSDTRTIIENLASLPEILVSIRQFTKKPVFVSTVSFSPNGKVDERLHTGFGTTWFLQCLKNLTHVDALVFSHFNIEKMARSPLVTVLKQLADFQPVCIRNTQTNDRVCFENRAGDTLTYVFNPLFSKAVVAPI